MWTPGGEAVFQAQLMEILTNKEYFFKKKHHPVGPENLSHRGCAAGGTVRREEKPFSVMLVVM